MKIFVCENCSKIEFTNKICSNCESLSLTEKNISDKVKLISFTEVKVGFGKFLNSPPYSLAILQLEQGNKILTKLENQNYKIDDELNFKGLDADSSPIFQIK